MSKTIHFITYADDKFKAAKSRLLRQAQDFDEFKTIKGYGPEDIPQTYYEKYKTYSQTPAWWWVLALASNYTNGCIEKNQK